MIVGIDAGITIGVAAVREGEEPVHWEAISTDKYKIDYSVSLIGKILLKWLPDTIVVEYPNPNSYNVLYTKLLVINAGIEKLVSDYKATSLSEINIVRVLPGEWKSTPAKHFDVKKPMSDHERDSIRMAVWYERFGSKQKRS